MANKHLLTLLDWSGDEIGAALDLGDKLKAEKKQGKAHPLLKGKTLAMIFQKSSTRTRVSFEVGMYQLGGYGLFLSANDLQMGRGEPIEDTARVLSRYVDGIMIRTFAQKDVEDLAQYGSVPVINGLTDRLPPLPGAGRSDDHAGVSGRPYRGRRCALSGTATTWPIPSSSAV